MRPPEIALALVGFGNVARRFVRVLDDMADRLEFTWRLVGIGTRHHGSVVVPEGIDATRAATLVEASQSLDRLDPAPDERSGLDLIRQITNQLGDEATAGRLVIVETTPLDADRGEPACAHVKAALEGLAHVITANKGPAAFAYGELEALAESVDRVFFFESAVMDGVPVFNLVRETMPGVTISGVRGVVNTTCQYILSSMEHGTAADDAVLEMQARGIAEADPSHDIDGWDAAAKTAILVNALLGGRVTPHDVARTGIRNIAPQEVTEAVARGRRVRLVASASLRGGRLDARVEPEMLDAADPLVALGPMENALYLHTDLLGDVGIVQRTSSLTQTAYGLVSDLSLISRRLRQI